MSVAEYNDLTPRELLMIVDEYNERTQRNREEGITLAYMSAYWHRAKRMPSLKQVLEESKPKRRSMPQTPEDMLKQIMRLQNEFEREGG